jgi:K+-transporting ATPase c subunit
MKAVDIPSGIPMPDASHLSQNCEPKPELVGKPLPADMITTSASGLDPDITPANALLQVARVPKAPEWINVNC